MNTHLSYVAVVTTLILFQYIYFTMRAGMARGKDTVVAPAMTGDQGFEKKVRVQLNTLEQMAIVIPAMWLCAYFFRADVAAGAGLLFLLGRFIYAAGYPEKRSTGMGITMLANMVLLICVLIGAVRTLGNL